MTPMKRPLAAAGASVLLALSLSACGGAPTDASEDDFCKSVEGVITVMTSTGDGDPSEDDWKKIQAAFEELGDTGTPEKIGEAERNGFESIIDAIGDLDYDEAKKSFGNAGGDEVPGLDKDDQKDAEKFFAYATTTCAGALTPDVEDLPSIDPDDIPSIDPEDLPSFDPDDMPSIDPSDFASLDPDDLASMQSELAELTEGLPTE